MSLYVCPVDARSCEVADAVGERCLRPGSRPTARMVQAFVHAAPCLACMRCRKADVQVQQLMGTRLGKHERNILMYSPSPQAGAGAILDPELSSHADRETYLRAVRKLARVGLIDVDTRLVRISTAGLRKDGTPVVRSYAHRTLQQTELAAIVVAFFRTDLETGRPIRWARHLEAIRSAYRWPIEKLLAHFTTELGRYIAELTLQPLEHGLDARQAREQRYLLQPVYDALSQS